MRDGELVIRDGRIVAAGDPPGAWTARQMLDVGQRLVLPGVIDGHVHALSDPTEGITAATTAAASGGVTTIIEMPFDAGAPINSAERLLAKRERVAQEAVVDVALLATLRGKRGGLDQVAPLAEGRRLWLQALPVRDGQRALPADRRRRAIAGVSPDRRDGADRRRAR